MSSFDLTIINLFLVHFQYIVIVGVVGVVVKVIASDSEMEGSKQEKFLSLNRFLNFLKTYK